MGAGIFHPAALNLIRLLADIDVALFVGQGGGGDVQVGCLNDAGVGDAVGKGQIDVVAADGAAGCRAGVVLRQKHLRHQRIDVRAKCCRE